jgi:ABC-2 type transport system permease protein
MATHVMPIAVKGVKEFLRNRMSFVFAVLFPIVIMVVFRIAFGGGGGTDASSYPVAVVDLDTGEGPWDVSDPPWLPYFNANGSVNLTASELFDQLIIQNQSTGGEFLVKKVLAKAELEGTDTRAFRITEYPTVEKGWNAVTDRKAAALVVVPANFSRALQGVVDRAVVDELRAHGITLNYSMPDYGDTAVNLSGELTSFDYSYAATLVTGQVMGYTEVVYHTVRVNTAMALGLAPVSEQAGSVMPHSVPIKLTRELNNFDMMLPGVIVFGLMMQAMGVTVTLGTEMKSKTLNRLRLTKMTSFDMMAGTTIRWMILGVIQVVLFMVVALLLGVRTGGPLPMAFAGAILIGLVVVIATLSLGLIISSFIDDPEQASQLSVVIVMPMAFLTGVFFPVDFEFAKALPWSQAAEAMKQVMVYGSWGDAMAHVAIVLVESLVLFAISVYLFSSRRLRS